MNLLDFFKAMKEKDASDLYLTADAPPALRIYGRIEPLNEPVLTALQIKEMAYSILTPEQIQHFEHTSEMNLARSEAEIGRFRINMFVQKGNPGMVIRNIHTVIPPMHLLGLPPLLADLVMEKRGLILFVGATGAGKSTSLASVINHRNETQSGHIICIEDPIEFVHVHKKSLINQREVGIDTQSYDAALKNALRQSPDVILIGEIRTTQTMEHALVFSETGHLCLSTLHANNANQALERILSFFSEEKRDQLLLDLSFNLKAIISQRLIPTVDGKRVAALEILLGTPLVLDYIRRGEIASIKELMEKSANLGMQTFDMALEQLYHAGRITLEEALKNADSKNNLRIKTEINAPHTSDTASDPKNPKDASDGLSLMADS